jgi:hypothetical protein
MLNDTTMAEKMLEAGYDTHAVGKWHMVSLLSTELNMLAHYADLIHQGFYKWAYTPTFRGFNSFLGFYSGIALSLAQSRSPTTLILLCIQVVKTISNTLQTTRTICTGTLHLVVAMAALNQPSILVRFCILL